MSTSIMRAVLDPTKVSSGAHGYRPTASDIADPTRCDKVPVYNRTGRAAAHTAANRCDPTTSIDQVSDCTVHLTTSAVA